MERECECCGKNLEPDEECFTLESGEVVCQDCHESIIGKCAECGEILTEDDEYRSRFDVKETRIKVVINSKKAVRILRDSYCFLHYKSNAFAYLLTASVICCMSART